MGECVRARRADRHTFELRRAVSLAATSAGSLLANRGVAGNANPVAVRSGNRVARLRRLFVRRVITVRVADLATLSDFSELVCRNLDA